MEERLSVEKLIEKVFEAKEMLIYDAEPSTFEKIRKSQTNVYTHRLRDTWRWLNAHSQKRQPKKTQDRPEKLFTTQKLRFALKSNSILYHFGWWNDMMWYDDRRALHQISIDKQCWWFINCNTWYFFHTFSSSFSGWQMNHERTRTCYTQCTQLKCWWYKIRTRQKWRKISLLDL